ncbi:DMT family transporter [Vibrio porteresiae]|uniref:DMT family transporter n=1 Tax=Vibrio porteresiae DSM 19223 TaxID=1123496 RepID=A0ABZ0QFJ8_9VIBR|nr:DMT family transporter [Vibrio porteresiae]WPC74957.1 DMT family transporter [Vibrio porteresiae DSM 19223]
MNWLYFVMALTSGIGLSVQAAVNSRLSVGVNGQPLMAAFISFTVGAICLGLLALTQVQWSGMSVQLAQQPWWRWTGGLIGASVVFTSIFLAPRIGITNAMFLFILGQLIAGMLIDSLGLIQMPIRPVYWWKYAGLAIMLIGLALFMFGDKWFGQR